MSSMVSAGRYAKSGKNKVEGAPYTAQGGPEEDWLCDN